MSSTLVRDLRPCPGCGEVAWRKVWVRPDGTDEFPPRLCGVCHARTEAAYHRAKADTFDEKAAQLLVRRLKAKKLHAERVREHEQRFGKK